MDTRPPLTRRQQTILDLIRTTVRDRGYPPSIRECGEAVGLSSSSSVAHQFKVLEARGYIIRDPHGARAITITDDQEPAPDRTLRMACRELINASLNLATNPGEDAEALIRQAKAWDAVAVALDAAEDAAHR